LSQLEVNLNELEITSSFSQVYVISSSLKLGADLETYLRRPYQAWSSSSQAEFQALLKHVFKMVQDGSRWLQACSESTLIHSKQTNLKGNMIYSI